MALAAEADVVARLGRPLTTAEQTRVSGLLEEADVLVLAYLGLDADPDPVPAAVRVVTSRVVARVIERAATQGVASDAESVTSQVGPFGRTLRFAAGSTSGGPWLTGADKTVLGPHRAGGGMVAVSIGSGRTGDYRVLS